MAREGSIMAPDAWVWTVGVVPGGRRGPRLLPGIAAVEVAVWGAAR